MYKNNLLVLPSFLLLAATLSSCGGGLNTQSPPIVVQTPGTTAPYLASLTTVSGVPTATGSSLNEIWAGSTPTFQYPSSGSSPGCASVSASGTGNLNLAFTSAGQTATGWAPGNNGGGAGSVFISKCVRLCTDFSATLCTNWIYVTGT